MKCPGELRVWSASAEAAVGADASKPQTVDWYRLVTKTPRGTSLRLVGALWAFRPQKFGIRTLPNSTERPRQERASQAASVRACRLVGWSR